MKDKEPPRGNGVTLVYAGQMFFTQPPCEADHRLIAQMQYAVKKFNEEGRPLSGG